MSSEQYMMEYILLLDLNPNCCLHVFGCSVCIDHCGYCDADDRGAGMCNDNGCDTGYKLDSTLKMCQFGESNN